MGGGDRSFDVFFSYHWRDHAPVEALARALTERGLRVFLDRWYLTPGQPWPQALERTLASCNSVAVFLGADGLGPWQQRERDLALDRQGREPGFPVIPVLLTRTDPALGFLKLNTWVDLSANVADDGALEILCAAVRGQPPGPLALQKTAAVRAEVCPYRGLQIFREEDAAFFCGREAFTDKLAEAVERTSLVAVIGASGSGKSSVVRAGLIPRLRQTTAGRVWEFATLVPTDRPLHSLAAALVPILEPEMTRIDRLAEVNKLAGLLADGTVALRDVASDVLRLQPGTDRLLLFVDQWEELYTLVADDAARRRFVAEILDASAKGAVTVVLTLRGDFFGQALSDRAFADRLQDGQVNLGPMTRDELRRSIVEPAEKVDLQFEPGVVDRILEDVGQEPGNLPLLEFVLAALWEQRQGGRLHHAAYEQMGGIEGAIAARADAEFAKLDDAQKEAAKHYLVQMVRPGEATDDTRQRAPLPAADATALAVIRRLADARLVVTALDAATGAETVEVTHEALIHNWSLLRGWVDADREFLRIKTRIEREAALWEAEKRDPSRLLAAGRPLAEGEMILAKRRSDLRASTVAYIEASAAAAARRRRRSVVMRAAALASGVLAIAGGGIYWDLYLRDHEEYYNAYVKRWGMLEGIGPVSADDAERRSRTLHIVRQGRFGPVTRLDALDGSGACARTGLQDPGIGGGDPLGIGDDPTRVCTFVWERDTKGRVSKQTMFDAARRMVGSLLYTGEDGLTAELRGQGGFLLPIGAASTITFERIDDGPNRGRDRLERYTDAAGQPRPMMGTGAFASRISYDRMGLVVQIVFLGQEGKPVRGAAGFAEVRVDYNQSGSIVEVSYFNENGHPVRTGSGIARRSMAYDDLGNQIAEAYFDEDGKPTLIDQSHAKLALAYDGRGKEIERTFFDEAGKPTLGKDGYARIARVLGPQDRPVEETYFDEAGKPTLSKNGYARVTRTYDGSGNPIGEAYFDADGKPTRNKTLYAKVTRVFDPRGWLVEVRYLDPVGQPTLSKDGYSKQTLTYDALGNPPTEEAIFDEAGKPTLSKDGYARIAKRYDGAGHLVEEAYFDQEGKPTLSKDEYARVVKAYDERGDVIRQAFFDEAGKPTLRDDWTARVDISRSVGGGDKNALVQLMQSDKPNFQPTVASLMSGGLVVKRDFHDESGKPTIGKGGYATSVSTQDARGNVIEEAFFDEHGNACPNKNGYHKVIMTYDADGNELTYAFFDENGKPVTPVWGYASTAFTYDVRGNVVERNYFDEAGKPTRSKDNYAGLTRAYDARGNVVEEAYFDEAGNPAAIERGYARIKLAYDERGNVTEDAYFDENAKPTRSKEGYAKQTLAYDERDNLTEQAFFDETGKPIRSTDGYARVAKGYDARGNAVEVAYFDEVGKPTRSTDGFATQKMVYDARGNVTEYAYFDENAKPTRSKDGYAKQSLTHDGRGNTTEATCLDEEGRPTRNTDGISGWTAAYDARGNVIKADVFDEKGKPTRSGDGYATIRKTYDARGNRIGEAYYDEEGNPIKSKDGYASVTKRYDARGNVVQEAYFDEKGDPARSKDGYAKITKAYNSRGEVIERAYFDEKGIAVHEPRVSTP